MRYVIGYYPIVANLVYEKERKKKSVKVSEITINSFHFYIGNKYRRFSGSKSCKISNESY